jgi:hypothetical protein
MTTFEAFDRELRLATADLEPEAINAALAQFAKKSLAEVISAGRASSRYERYVNGRQGAPEEAVEAPGPIVYEFSFWEPIITFAIDEITRRSPKKSGRFARSFVVLANQKPVTDYASISPEAEVIITNVQPYIRKVEAGVVGGQKRFFVFDGTKRALARQFGNDSGRNAAAFRFDTKWLDIPGGILPGVPYILKGEHGRRLTAWRANPKSGPRIRRRKELEAGIPITYPAIVINQVF